MSSRGYEPRTYRERTRAGDLRAYEVVVAETDLLIRGDPDRAGVAEEAVRRARGEIEAEIARRPEFQTSLEPLQGAGEASALVAEMYAAAAVCGVGPMAAVAGAVAEVVARALAKLEAEVIVENGGDIFLATERERTVAIHAGGSSFSDRLGLVVPAAAQPVAVCTSSGTVGHSYSQGHADAVAVAAPAGALADAAATALANRVRSTADVEPALAVAREWAGLCQVVIIIGDAMGAWGEYELAPLSPG